MGHTVEQAVRVLVTRRFVHRAYLLFDSISSEWSVCRLVLCRL